MFGLQIQRKVRSWGAVSSAALFFVSLAMGIGWGPVSVYVVSAAGVAAALVGLRQATGSRMIPVILLSLHVVLVGVAGACHRLFLSPLSEARLQMPSLGHVYKDPDGFFEIKGPIGWTYQSIASRYEYGVRIRPLGPEQYMGVSECTVIIRELAQSPQGADRFLGKMADSLSQRPGDKDRQFEFDITPIRLLAGGSGQLSTLVVKRLWVPISQISLFGLKQKRFLCTVSATGLGNHATLAPVFCLGIFETIKVRRLKN